MVESAVIVIIVKYSFEVDERCALPVVGGTGLWAAAREPQ